MRYHFLMSLVLFLFYLKNWQSFEIFNIFDDIRLNCGQMDYCGPPLISATEYHFALDIRAFWAHSQLKLILYSVDILFLLLLITPGPVKLFSETKIVSVYILD